MNAAEIRPPATGEVGVWLLDPSRIDGTARHGALLDRQDNIKLARFRNRDKREEFIHSRALVRTVLAACVGSDPRELRFVEGEHGKPALVDDVAGPWRFNLSHADGLIACAVTRDHDVGVDVEAHDRRGTLLDIASRFFAPSELAELHSHSRATQRERFFTYWTLKEAWLKARGTGMTLPLRGFAIDLEHDGGPIGIRFTPEIDDDPAHWSFASLQPSRRHRLSVALHHGEGFELSIRRLAARQ